MVELDLYESRLFGRICYGLVEMKKDMLISKIMKLMWFE